MPLPARIALLVFAAICCAFVVLLGTSVSYGLEPYRFSFRTIMFWSALGLAVSFPLWLPAVVPNRFPRALSYARWLGAIALTLPTYYFFGIVTHNIARSINGLGATQSAFVQGVILSSACVVGFVILLWPELRRCFTALGRHR